MQPRLASALVAATLMGVGAPGVDASAAEYTLGPFTLTVDADENAVEIVNSAGDQVWRSASDRAFISASSGLTTITQASGNFELSSNDVGEGSCLCYAHGGFDLCKYPGCETKVRVRGVCSAHGRPTTTEASTVADYDTGSVAGEESFLVNVSSKSTGYNTSFYAIAASEGRFVANATVGDGSAWTITSGPGIDAGLLDLSNQSTIDWFKALVKEQYYSVPISGMMQDFGEYLSVGSSVSLSSGTVSPRVFHNDYPTVWATLLREVVTELGLENDTIGFHRSAGTFSAKHTNLFWVGDQNIDVSREDGMRAVVSSALHIGASGFGQTHSDVGGYTNTLATVGNITRNTALLGRWGELGAFSGTAFRTHEGNKHPADERAGLHERDDASLPRLQCATVSVGAAGRVPNKRLAARPTSYGVLSERLDRSRRH